MRNCSCNQYRRPGREFEGKCFWWPYVRPILIFSINNKIDVYITGEMIKNATLYSYEREKQDFISIGGGVYFDFKDAGARKKAVEALKGMIKTHEENIKINQETGKDIPYPETAGSFFWGSFVGGGYDWGISEDHSTREKIDNFRFLSMRIKATLPISMKDWKKPR